MTPMIGYDEDDTRKTSAVAQHEIYEYKSASKSIMLD